MKLPISIIILTFNEEKNIESCLQSISGFVEDIYVVDSFSTDDTLKIAKKYNAKIFQNPFEYQAKQLNWALANIKINTKWVMRIDSDEVVTSELLDELSNKLPQLPQNISGLYVKRKVYFMGKWIRFGGYYPTWLLRIWRNEEALCEDQILNEHMILLKGKAEYLKSNIIDNNQKGIAFWIEKHNNFSSRFARELIAIKEKKISGTSSVRSNLSGSQAEQKRWIKENVYTHLPLFLRCYMYFIYSYFFRLGFLDGLRGLIFHSLHDFWYLFLTDTKIYEMQKKSK